MLLRSSWQQFQNQMTQKSSSNVNYVRSCRAAFTVQCSSFGRRDQNDLVESLRALSKTGSTTVESAELRYSMTNMGEKLDDDVSPSLAFVPCAAALTVLIRSVPLQEMNLMLLEADPDSTGSVNVEALAKVRSPNHA